MIPVGNRHKGIVMKLSIGLITSVSNLVSGATATAILHCGIAVCALAPLPSLAQSVGIATSLSSTLYVDCAATSRGNGSSAHPYWRITDALERARLLRSSTSTRLTIRVAPGTCSGNFETQPTGHRTRPPELLPLVLNVPNLTLHGAGVMEYAEGFPVAPRAGTATTVTVDIQRLGILDNTVIYVGPTTDGGRADGTVIEGLVIDNVFNSWYGLFISRTQHITVRYNVVEHVNFGAINGSECSGRIVGNVVHDGTPGMVFAAGTPSNPSRLYIGGNTATMNYEGVAFFGSSIATENLDMGANPLEVLPYPINPTARQMGNHIEVEFAGNDVSNNFVGLRFAMLGGAKYPYAQTSNISANVHDNRFIDNSGYPFAVDQGFVFRGTDAAYWTNPNPANFPEGFLGSLAAPFITHGPFDGPYSADLSVTLEGNVWKNPGVDPIAPAILTFSYIDVYDPKTGEPDPSLVPEYTYMRNSRLSFDDEDGLLSQLGVIRDDLRLYDPFDGAALLNQTRTRR
jgi:hypothetical protein